MRSETPSWNTRAYRRGVMLVILLALAVRLFYLGVLYIHPYVDGGEHLFRKLIPYTWQKFYPELVSDCPFSDQLSFDSIARNLADGKGYRLRAEDPPTAFRAPVYPFLLALLHLSDGNIFIPARIINLLMELGTVWLLIAISRRIFHDAKAALLAGGFYAVYFPSVVYSITIFSETIYTFLLALFVYTYLRAAQADTDRTAPAHLGAGALLGVVTLTKPTALLLPAFLILPLLWRKRRLTFLRHDVLRRVIPLTIGMLIVLTPWTIRNYQVLGRLVPVTTGGGRALWACNYVPPDDPMIPHAQQGVGQDTPTTDQGFYESALDNIISRPGAFIKLALQKFVRLWFNLGFGRPPSPASVLLGTVNMILAAFMLIALILCWGPWTSRASIIFYLLVYFSLLHMALIGYIRYALPVIPHLMVVSSFGALCLYRRLAEGRARA